MSDARESFDVTVELNDFSAKPDLTLQRYGWCGISRARATEVYAKAQAIIEAESEGRHLESCDELRAKLEAADAQVTALQQERDAEHQARIEHGNKALEHWQEMLKQQDRAEKAESQLAAHAQQITRLRELVKEWRQEWVIPIAKLEEALGPPLVPPIQEG